MIEKDISLIDVIPDFRELPQLTKEWLLERSTLTHFDSGDYVFEKGDAIHSMRLLVKGQVQMRVQQKDGWRELGSFEEGAITGLLPYSRLQSSSNFAIAISPVVILSLHKDHFPELIRNHQELTEILVHNMTSRVRAFTKSQQQNEKLIALGKLSAGLAHELNNPAAAIVRSSHSLKKHLSTVPEKFKRIMDIQADERQVNLVNDVLFKKIKSGQVKISLSERTNREDEVTDYLEEKGYEEAFETAELFVDFGFTQDDFEYLSSELKERDFPSVMGWLAQVLTTEKMVDEIENASSRIADLVKSIKSYTHMDRSQEKVMTNPVSGIEDTLTILNHKLKQKGIQLNLEVMKDLPEINILPSEINQVWMNLIDNAIDAIPEKEGKLDILISKQNDFLQVCVIDNGAGIEEEVLSKIFDPFFTTKKVGEGTGLGLDVAKRVVENHRGTLKVKSQKGQTSFEVCIPYND